VAHGGDPARTANARVIPGFGYSSKPQESGETYLHKHLTMQTVKRIETDPEVMFGNP